MVIFQSSKILEFYASTAEGILQPVSKLKWKSWHQYRTLRRIVLSRMLRGTWYNAYVAYTRQNISRVQAGCKKQHALLVGSRKANSHDFLLYAPVTLQPSATRLIKN